MRLPPHVKANGKGPGQVVLPRARIFPGGSGIPAAAVFLPILLQMLFEEFCHLPEVESGFRRIRNHVILGVRHAFKNDEARVAAGFKEFQVSAHRVAQEKVACAGGKPDMSP